MPVIDDASELADELAALTQATRRLMLAAATTQLDPVSLRSARIRMDAFAADLSVGSRTRMMRSDPDGPWSSREMGPDDRWPIFRYNPQAFPLEVAFDGDVATARIHPNALYEGPPESVHGGYLSHVLDCILGTLVQATGRRALTATLDLRYLAPTPLDVPLDLVARITEAQGRKVMTEAWIEHEGRRTVEARGLFIDVAGVVRAPVAPAGVR